MAELNAAPAYPTAEHIQKGPPDPVREPERAKAEKWCRVHAVVPVPRRDVDGGNSNEFAVKGPFTVPMAVRRKGTDLGSRDAWIFFTHPWSVFHKDSVFFNAPKSPRGILEARIVARGPSGVRLYDEVGAGFQSERVPNAFASALGVFRSRYLGAEMNGPYVADLIRLELDVLECFRLCTLCLKTRSPINALAEIDKLLKKSNPRTFTAEVFDDGDRAVIRQFGNLREGGTLTEVTSRFRVDERQFTQYTEVKDGKGRQLVLDLINEWQRFENEHGPRVETLGREIGACEVEARRIALEIEREKDASNEENAVTRFLTRRRGVIKKLQGDRAALLDKKKALEAEYDAIPGYDRVKGLSERIEGFKKIVDGVSRLASNVFDHNVTQQQIKSLEEIYQKIVNGGPDTQKSAYKNYDMRLRAEVFPRILAAFAISAYVLRRGDSLALGTSSMKNVRRINSMARDLVEYYRDAKAGDKTVGTVYDETWGQIEALEARF